MWMVTNNNINALFYKKIYYKLRITSRFFIKLSSDMKACDNNI